MILPVFAISALGLGLLSSLHCLGMCGPLVIGILPPGKTSAFKVLILSLYHSGRIGIYSLLGLLTGLLGSGLDLARFQQWLSIIPGVLILIWLSNKIYRWIPAGDGTLLNSMFQKPLGRFMAISHPVKYALLGMLNGLLPCGMVYIALAGALASGTFTGSLLFMVIFGLGTLPLLVSVSFAGNLLKTRARLLVNRLQPAFLLVFACLLIIRGLNLGIPYLSPKIATVDKTSTLECCQKK